MYIRKQQAQTQSNRKPVWRAIRGATPATGVAALVFCGAIFAQDESTLRQISEAQVAPVDLAILARPDPMKGLDCEVAAKPADIGIDLRYHAGYSVAIPLRSLAGNGGELRTVLRVTYLDGQPQHSTTFSWHMPVPPIPEPAKGEARLTQEFAVGPGHYRVDWLTRTGPSAACSAHWRIEAKVNADLKRAPLALAPGQVEELPPYPFQVPPLDVRRSSHPLDVKVLVNYSASDASLAMLSRKDVRALTGILTAVTREPRFGRFSVVAFSTDLDRVIYRQPARSHIDFTALGKAVEKLPSGTIDIHQVEDPGSSVRFLAGVLSSEFAPAEATPDAVIVIGPDALGGKIADKPLAAMIHCPVFFLKYNPDPIGNPWHGVLTRIIKACHGLEYTITRPVDLGVALMDMGTRLNAVQYRPAPASQLRP